MGAMPPTAAAQIDTRGWERMTVGLRPSENQVEAGCAILYEKVAEAFEPEWRDIVRRVYLAMSD